MRYHMGIAPALIGAAMMMGGASAADPDQGAPPSPQAFLKEGKPADFIAPAKTYLEKQPPSPEALQVAGDLLMVATLVKDENLIRNAKLRLLAEYPSSVTGQYLLSEMLAEHYNKFLRKCFDKIDLQTEPRTLGLWNRAVETGFEHYGPRFAEDSLLAQAAIAADDPAKGLALRKSIRFVKEESIHTLDIALDPERTIRQKLISLKKTGSLAATYRTILYDARLTAEEQADPELAAVVAEPLLKNGDFAKAEAVLAKVRGVSDPRLLFWLAWAQGANGKSKDAAASLASLLKDHPSSLWAKPAAELLPAMQELEKNLTDHALAVDAALKSLAASPPALLEIHAQSGPGAKTPFAGYLSLDSTNDRSEFSLEIAGKPVAALQVTSGGNRLFLQGSPAIHQSAEGYEIPYPVPQVKDKWNGEWKIADDLWKLPAGKALQGDLVKLLSSPVLSNAEVHRELLQRLVRGGRFPAPVQTDGEERVFRWLMPRGDRPELFVAEIRVSKEDRIVSAKWGDIVSAQVRSGRDLTLTPPRWPDLPTEKQEKKLSEAFELAARLWPLVDALRIYDDGEEEKVEIAKKEPK